MKKALATLVLTVLALTFSAFAQEGAEAKQDVKDAAHATADATKAAGRGVKKHTKRAYHATKRGAKRAARATKNAAEKTEDKMEAPK